ncbi:MAG: peptide-methionine (S)-S-oxide reductase MsrA [Verrucomicrobiae bacterium]|nr:peptide-methionine (S)-S-oxide reductase MsrA [Verrucomicrobiae bacterium]
MRWLLTAPLWVGALALLAAEPKTNSTSLMKTTNQLERATLGGGCFWCMEAVFERVPGVRAVTSGYAGGHVANPTYEQVCTGETGHAEVVQIEYDPARVSFEQLLELFWKAHDPTSLNRQGADVGTQYRSVIFYENERQKLAAEKSKADAARNFSRPIVTEIAPLKAFYPAEAYHQDYYRKNPNAAYCRMVIRPKLEKLERELPPGP